jgi:hypothetical protein
MVSVSTLAHNKAIAPDARSDLTEISSGFMPYKCPKVVTVIRKWDVNVEVSKFLHDRS